MKATLLILISVIFIACNESSNFEGVWVSCCKKRKNDSVIFLTGVPPQSFMSFKGENFEYGEYLNGSAFYYSEKYEVKKKRIYLGESKEPWFDFRIKNFHEMHFTNQNDLVQIFKRLPDSLHYIGPERLKLKNKRFKVLRGKEVIDTAHFVNDSVVSWSSRLKETGANKWMIHDVSEFKILSIKWLGQSIIHKVENKRIDLVSFEKNPAELIFEEIESKNTVTSPPWSK